MTTKQLQKAFTIPASLRRMQSQGQVPTRENIELMRMAREQPQPMSVARMLNHDEPVLTTNGIIRDLGLNIPQLSDWGTFLNETLASSNNEVTLRQSILGKCLDQGLDPAMRRAIFQRSLTRWRDLRRSLVTIVTPDDLIKSRESDKPDQLEKADPRGGGYHRRVPKKGGGYRYYYDETKYQSSKDAHLSGEEGSAANITANVMKAVEGAGEGGCGIDQFAPLVKQYGAKRVAKVLKGGCGGKIMYKGGKFRSQTKPQPKRTPVLKDKK